MMAPGVVVRTPRGMGIIQYFTVAGDVCVHLFGRGSIPWSFDSSDVEVL